jgi:hypothetical protein
VCHVKLKSERRMVRHLERIHGQASAS